MTLNKLADPVLPHRPLYDLFCKISNDLTGGRDMPIGQAIDIAQKGVFLSIIKALIEV
jgi:hypothetical protein